MSTIHIDDFDRARYEKRIGALAVVAMFAFVLLVTRLALLQLARGGKYEKMSKAQKLRSIVIPPMRGDILDRNGHPLAVTREAFSLLLYSDPSLREVTDLSGTIAELLGRNKVDIDKRFELRKQTAQFQPTEIIENLSRDDVAALEENLAGIGGLEIELAHRRIYPQGNAASQLIGYLGEVTGKDLDPFSNKEYRSGDLIGKMGVEAGWEETLRGSNGFQQVVVDSTGRRNQLFEKELKLPPPKAPIPGTNIELTIDLDLQRATELAMGENAGAAVVMDVRTGEILAMASTPGFDPNLLSGRVHPEEWKRIQEDERKPLYFRAIQGEYPPASIYKIAVIAAALEEGIVRPEDLVKCNAVVEIGANKDKYHCWNAFGHGMVDAYRAMSESCDVYFYRIGERLGIDKIVEYSYKFGLGEPVGLNIRGERDGLIPIPKWKLEVIGKPWYLGDTVITAIGQGYTLVTPLQGARLVSVIASGGKLIKPHLVRKILNRDGTVVRDFITEVEIPQVISPEVCATITRSMIGVVNDPRATGYGYIGSPGTTVAGKTGTAQVISRKKKAEFMETEGDIPWKYRDHSWFVAFAPASNPRIAVSVFVEHGGPGGAVAEPIAGMIIKHYMENQYKQTGMR